MIDALPFLLESLEIICSFKTHHLMGSAGAIAPSMEENAGMVMVAMESRITKAAQEWDYTGRRRPLPCRSESESSYGNWVYIASDGGDAGIGTTERQFMGNGRVVEMRIVG